MGGRSILVVGKLGEFGFAALLLPLLCESLPDTESESSFLNPLLGRGAGRPQIKNCGRVGKLDPRSESARKKGASLF